MYKYRGFTLVELAVTVTVLGILVAIAVPSFHDLIVKRKLRGASELVYSQLLFAKTQAIKESNTIRVTFEDGVGAAWKFGMTNAAADCDPGADPGDCVLTYEDEGGTAQSMSVEFDGTDFPDVTVGGAVGTITFEPIPTAAAGDSVITLATADPAYNIGVKVSLIGTVTMCEPGTSHDFGYTACPPVPVPVP